MSVHREPSLDYLTGFFDADGSIHIGGSDRPRFEINVTQARLDILSLYKGRFGGITRVHTPGPIADRRVEGVTRQTWRWRLRGYPGVEVLRLMRPLLIVKRERAEEALAWWDERIKARVRSRMPNAYYAEQYALGEDPVKALDSRGTRAGELARREAWAA